MYEGVDATLAEVESRGSVYHRVGDLERHLIAVRRHPTLDATDAADLARVIERGRDALRRLDEAVDLPAEDQDALHTSVAEAREAERILTEANLRLVVAIAREYEPTGLPRIELIEAGNLGLIAAVDTYEWRRGFTFWTFATWWIRQAITRRMRLTP